MPVRTQHTQIDAYVFRNNGLLAPRKDFYLWFVYLVGNRMVERIEINRSEPLEMDGRGRVTIPANIRSKHEINPDTEDQIWVEVDIKHVEIKHDEDDGGER